MDLEKLISTLLVCISAWQGHHNHETICHTPHWGRFLAGGREKDSVNKQISHVYPPVTGEGGRKLGILGGELPLCGPPPPPSPHKLYCSYWLLPACSPTGFCHSAACTHTHTQDEELARQLVELGYRGSGEVLKREEFEAKKQAAAASKLTKRDRQK